MGKMNNKREKKERKNETTVNMMIWGMDRKTGMVFKRWLDVYFIHRYLSITKAVVLSSYFFV